MSKKNIYLSALTLSILGFSSSSLAGAFIFAGESNGENLITHPIGYTGTGGILNIEVCIRPTSSNTANLEQPVKNIIAIWNEKKTTTSNLLNNLPDFSSYDVEAVTTHEVGHCLGLAHTNIASESGLSGADQNYTKTTDGADNTYNLTIGTDAVRGSTDDSRGDDANLHWYRTSNNNPFSIASIIDSTTYTKDVNNLPATHTSVANADRDVSSLFSAPNTEAIMQQGTYNAEVQRTLSPDDVATLKLAESGLDTTSGTSDDYSVNLTYGGISDTASCGINIGFDNNETGFAVCKTAGSFLGSHTKITSAEIYLNDSFNWHYNTDKPCSKSFSATANQWKMLSLPCQVGISTDATVQAQLGDDLNTAEYDSTWVVYRYDPSNNNYTKVNLTDELEEGIGYWFITTTTGITVDIEGQYNANIDIPLVGSSTGKWNMIGSPFRLSIPWSTATVIKSDGSLLDLAASDPSNACSETPISASCAMANKAFSYNGSTYITLTTSSGNLDPFDAAWVFAGQENIILRLPMSSTERTTQ